MSVSYNKLWKMLTDQKLSHIELQSQKAVPARFDVGVKKISPPKIAIFMSPLSFLAGCGEPWGLDTGRQGAGSGRDVGSK